MQRRLRRHWAGPHLLPFAHPDGARRSTGRRSCYLRRAGFAGAFSEHVLDAAGGDLAASELFLIGTRAARRRPRGNHRRLESPMPSHSLGVPKLADRIAEALYARISMGEIDRLDASSANGTGPDPCRTQPLVPFDMSAFPRSTDANGLS